MTMRWMDWLDTPLGEQLKGEKDRAQADEVRRLAEALRRYGKHDKYCHRNYSCGCPCDCGLDAVLAATAQETEGGES